MGSPARGTGSPDQAQSAAIRGKEIQVLAARRQRGDILRRGATTAANQPGASRQPLRQIGRKRRAGFTVMMPGLGQRIIVLAGVRIDHQRQRRQAVQMLQRGGGIF